MGRTSPRLRVLVVDDSADFRLVVRLALEDHPSFEIVGEAGSGSEAAGLAASCEPDLVLLDTDLGDLDAFDALPVIRAAADHARIVLLSSHHAADLQPAIQAAGAVGFLDKGVPARQIGEELEAVAGLVGAIQAVLDETRTQLERDAASPRAARRFVRDALSQWDLDELTDTVTLLVSELVTNAVVHAQSEVEVLVRLTPDAARVEVTDTSDVGLAPRDANEDETSGRGLALVATMARRWGVRAVPGGGKTVWFEVDRTPVSADDGR